MENQGKKPILKAGERVFKMVEAYVRASNSTAEIIGILRSGQQKRIDDFKGVGKQVLECLLDYIEATSGLALEAGIPKKLFVEEK